MVKDSSVIDVLKLLSIRVCFLLLSQKMVTKEYDEYEDVMSDSRLIVGLCMNKKDARIIRRGNSRRAHNASNTQTGFHSRPSTKRG